MFRGQVPYLKPDHDRVPRRAVPAPGDLEKPVAEEEHHPRIRRRAELPVDRQAQDVALEALAAGQVGRAQQDPAAQYLHATIMAARPPAAVAWAHQARAAAATSSKERRRSAGSWVWVVIMSSL